MIWRVHFTSLTCLNIKQWCRTLSGCSRVSPWLKKVQCGKGSSVVGGFYWWGEGWEGEVGVVILQKWNHAFRRSTRTPLHCGVQSPSSRRSLCPLSCGWERVHWLCWWWTICSGRESLATHTWYDDALGTGAWFAFYFFSLPTVHVLFL